MHQPDGLSVCWLGTILLARCPAIGISQVAPAKIILGFEFYCFFEHARRVGRMAGVRVNHAKVGVGLCVRLGLECAAVHGCRLVKLAQIVVGQAQFV